MHNSRCPFQIGVCADPINYAEKRDHLVKKDDIIVMGSDGFWGNINIDCIKQVIILLTNELHTLSVSQCSERLVDAAYLQSIKEDNEDDITVAVAQIKTCKK